MTAAEGGPERLGAVVLTGGTGARLGGADKAGLEVGGVSLLERALAATVAAVEVVVVGAAVPTTRPVHWTREDPPGGGPAAGLLAGLRALAEQGDLPLVVVLAVDMPRVTAATLARLTWAVEREPVDGALLVDHEGRRQLLCGVYRTAALLRAAPASREDEHGLPVRRLLGGLVLGEVAALEQEAADVDTWADLRALDRPGP